MHGFVPQVDPLSARAIEAMALAFLAEVQPACLRESTPFDVATFIEFELESKFNIGFDVRAMPSGTEGDFNGHRITLAERVYDGLLQGVPRDRFSACHELAHAILHRKQILKVSRDQWVPRSAIAAYRDPEWQANRMASALIVPITTVGRAMTGHTSGTPADFQSMLAVQTKASLPCVRQRISGLERSGILAELRAKLGTSPSTDGRG